MPWLTGARVERESLMVTNLFSVGDIRLEPGESCTGED